MDNVELQTRHYERNLAFYGPSLEALGWHSRTSQCVRFEALSSIGDLNGCSVLDVGCGFGDFFGYLQEKGVKPRRYLGVDLVGGMIKEARKFYPKGTFEVHDILSYDIGHFDHVLASGIFGLESPTWDLYVRSMLTKMFRICRIGIGVNFLLAGEERNPDSHYADFNAMIDLASSISPKIGYKLGYKINDFTLFIYR